MQDGEQRTDIEGAAEPPPGGHRRRRRLGELLLAAGVITEAAIRDAIDLAAPGERLGSVLIRLGLVSEAEVADALAQQLRLERVDLDTGWTASPEVVARLPPALAERYDVLPLSLEEDTLRLATADPSDVAALDDVRLATGVRRVRPVVVTAAQLQRARRDAYRSPAVQELLWSHAESATALPPGARDPEDPATARLRLLLEEASAAGASDLLLEPHPGGGRARLRIDGVLRTVAELPGGLHPRLVSRCKVLADLDLADHRHPQEGAARLDVDRRSLDLRIAVTPTLEGESVAVHLRPRADQLPRLGHLGLAPALVRELTTRLRRPRGLVVLAGPAGAGTTTTAYAAVQAVADPGRAVCTLEDPVEVRWPGVDQLEVAAGDPTVSTLEHLLRRETDLLLLGELRDAETARRVVAATADGQLLVTTLHVVDAVAVLERLLDLGCDRFLLADALELVVAQRLVRRTCPGCRTPDTADPDVVAALGLDPGVVAAAPLRRGAGCEACGGTGVQGRQAVAEHLTVVAEVRSVLTGGGSSTELTAAVHASGLVPLRASAVALALRGEITLEEALLATPDPRWTAG